LTETEVEIYSFYDPRCRSKVVATEVKNIIASAIRQSEVRSSFLVNINPASVG
jgi:hypothetical protein